MFRNQRQISIKNAGLPDPKLRLNQLNYSWNTSKNIELGMDVQGNNFNGVNPPTPAILASSNFTYLNETAPEKYYISTINSREPYAAEVIFTPYGELSSRVGTNLGR